MTSPWGVYDGMPPLVDANVNMNSHPTPGPRHIPPPVGAAMQMPNGPPPAPRIAPMPATIQQPWGGPTPNYTFPNPQHDPYAVWRAYYGNAAYPQQSGPSPYIPHQPLHPEMQARDPFAHLRRVQTQPNPPVPLPVPAPAPAPVVPPLMPGARKRSISMHKHSPWPSQGDLSPLDLPTRMPDVHQFVPRAPDMHTPSSTLSRSISSGAVGLYPDRPPQWRQDFKFKSGFASMLRSWSSPSRTLDDGTDSSKLELHPFLRYAKSRPMTIYDLRRDPLSLTFRPLDHPPLANDMDHSVTHPPTQYMRLYHARLPWYIEIRANGAPYISLADFFQQLFAALGKQISKYDFYNGELDEEDRDVLTRAFFARCRHEHEKMEGVKRVDFLRGKYTWMGLMPGKNGMWRLRTG